MTYEQIEDEDRGRRQAEADGEWIKSLVDDGIAAERARIRKGLLAAQPRNLTELIFALDRICPAQESLQEEPK